MCAVECDGLCGGEGACEGLRRRGAEGESPGRSAGLIKQRPWQRLRDTAASAPSPGRPLYCRTGSCSGRSSPPVCPHEETRHCRGSPGSPVLTHTRTRGHICLVLIIVRYVDIFHFVRSNTDYESRYYVLCFEQAVVTPWSRQCRNIEEKH